jgi:ppGpp synthetase/RelA/SpoT-type nucleotidyltranferase
MRWPLRLYNSEEIDAAGLILAQDETEANEAQAGDFIHARAVVSNFRGIHHMPLNTFQTTLREKASVFDNAVVAQRIKRMPAIRFKLKKRTEKPIALSAMQDIGGCRAVLGTHSEVDRLCKKYLNSSLKHKLIQHDDYISMPKFSGYRGVHLVYQYKSDKKETYNGLKIELQFRTQIQHAWATAVEIVGFFRRELLKSSEGDHAWKQFFKLMAAELAFEEGATFGIPGISTDRNLIRSELKRCAEHLDAMNYLNSVGNGVSQIKETDVLDAHYFLLELDPTTRQLNITGYKFQARELANLAYEDVERSILGSTGHERDAVLVSASSFAELKKAYVNYFLDMSRFISLAEEAVLG